MMADWIKEWAIVISGGATFLLALAAFWAIWQNHRIRTENKKLEIKALALNDMKVLAIEFQQLVFLAGTGLGHEKRQFGTRFTNVLSDYPAIVKYGDLFGEEIKEKAKSLADCITAFNKELVSRELKKERVELRDRVINSVSEFYDAVIKERIRLFFS